MENYKPTNGQIIELTGEHDAGKTLASLFVNYQYGIQLKKIAFFHDDVKYPGYPPKSFGLFVDLVKETKGMKLFDYRQFVLDAISKIKPGQYEAIVFDTWPKFGESLRNYVVANGHQFRNKNEFVMRHDSKVVGAQTWKDAHNYEASIASEIASLTDCLIVTAHLKDDYKGGAKAGQTDELGKAWDKICNMRLWLRHNKNSGVPISLVLKRPHRPGIDENGMATTVDILPRKITPLPDEKSIWQSINRYWHNPVDGRELTKDEKPTGFELYILDGILTEDMKEVWRAELKEKERQEQGLELFENEQYEEVKEKVKSMNGLPPMAIAQKVNKEFDTNYTPKEIEEMLKNG